MFRIASHHEKDMDEFHYAGLGFRVVVPRALDDQFAPLPTLAVIHAHHVNPDLSVPR
jgi:hypothetical protein